jgi:hypothetical protein
MYIYNFTINTTTHFWTLFELFSENAHGCFVIVISFKIFAILYIYKNHCIRNTSDIFVPTATFKASCLSA